MAQAEVLERIACRKTCSPGVGLGSGGLPGGLLHGRAPRGSVRHGFGALGAGLVCVRRATTFLK